MINMPRNNRRKRGKTCTSTTVVPLHIQEQVEEALRSLDSNETFSARKAKRILKCKLALDNIGQIIHHSEEIDKEILYEIATRKLVEKEKATKAFTLFDKDGKGVVVLEDLQRVATELDESLSVEELEEMINEVDRSGDGLLTTNDFLRIAREVGL